MPKSYKKARFRKTKSYMDFEGRARPKKVIKEAVFEGKRGKKAHFWGCQDPFAIVFLRHGKRCQNEEITESSEHRNAP